MGRVRRSRVRKRPYTFLFDGVDDRGVRVTQMIFWSEYYAVNTTGTTWLITGLFCAQAIAAVTLLRDTCGIVVAETRYPKIDLTVFLIDHLATITNPLDRRIESSSRVVK